METFFQYNKYLFIFAHPDDEIYTCAFIKKLIEVGKKVDLLYITSGDYQGPEIATIREAELMESVKVLNVEVSRVHFLRIPERKLMGGLNGVCKMTSELVSGLLPDSIVGHDFEGGHNGHDAASFVASRLAEKFATPFYVFPAYNGWPEERQWNQFGSSRKITDTLPLTFDLKNIQDKVIVAHKSQKVFFDTIKGSSSYKLFSSREVLSLVAGSINYAEPPTVPLGYEYPNSKLCFNDFKKTVASI